MEINKNKLLTVPAMNELVVKSQEENCEITIAFIEDISKYAIAVKYIAGNSGLYSGLSAAVKGAHIRHEFHYNTDAIVVYELEEALIDIVLLSTYWGQVDDTYDPIEGVLYSFQFKESTLEMIENKLSQEEVNQYELTLAEPTIDLDFWMHNHQINEPIQNGASISL
ncbi:hypothetical protein MZM54_05410 [[Brevibacterium] frigoritolerans]|nr:hypothetical protein [Peribacillus frigoritolerans]